jgi:hypothetical protein
MNASRFVIREGIASKLNRSERSRKNRVLHGVFNAEKTVQDNVFMPQPEA